MRKNSSSCIIGRSFTFLPAWSLICLFLCILPTADIFAAEIYFGVIQDPDGYSNVRKGPGMEYEVVDTLYDGEEFIYEQLEGNWWKVYTKDPKTYSHLRNNGYLHRSRIMNTNSTPTVGSIADTVLQKFYNRYISVQSQAGDDKTDLKFGIAKLLHGEYNIHDDTRNYYLYSGPGTNFRPTIRRWDGYPYLYKPESSDWIAVFNAVDTILVGYAPKNDIEEVAGTDLKAYYISYFDDNGEEIGFMGSCAPGGDSYFIVPDTLKNELLVVYKEMLFSPWSRMERSKTMLEIIREDVISVDGLTFIKSPCLLYKSMVDYNNEGINLLRSCFQRLPVYMDSSFIEVNRINQYLPSYYNPIEYKPLFGKYFEENILDFLNSNFGSYSFYAEGHESNRLSFQVTVEHEPCYLIYYYQNATFLLSRNAFRNVDYPLLDLGSEFERDLKSVLNLDVAAILEQYGNPVFMNNDILVYLTGPQRQLLNKAGTNLYRGLEGTIVESANGIVFFEIDNDKVIVAGSTIFSDYRMPLMYYIN